MREKRFKLLSIVLVFMFLITGCASKKDGGSTGAPAAFEEKSQVMDNVNNGVGISKPEEKPAATGDKAKESKNTDVISERKIVKTGSSVLETLKFEESLNAVLKEIEDKGGYVENSNIQGRNTRDQLYIYNGKERYSQNRSANIIARVPQDTFDSFLNNVGTFGNVVSKSVSGEDVTSQYFDTEARLKSLQIQEERILELLKKAGELKDVIELEKHLSELRYEIESLTGTLKKWDNMVSYSQVSINLIEVIELTAEEKTPVTLGEKIVSALENSTKGLINLGKSFLIFIALILPYALVIGVLIVIIRFIRKKFNFKPTKIKLPFKNKKE